MRLRPLSPTGSYSESIKHLNRMLEIADEVKRGADGGMPIDSLLATRSATAVLTAPNEPSRLPSQRSSPALEAKYARIRAYLTVCGVIFDICALIGRLELALEQLAFLIDAADRPEYRNPLNDKECATHGRRS